MKTSLFTLLVACAATLVACSSETNDPAEGTPEARVEPPSEASDVESVYGQIGNACNDGSLTRSFDVAAATRDAVLWSVPTDDPAALRAAKISGKWSELVAVSTLDGNGIAETFQTTSSDQAARCGAAREIFAPISGGDRRSFLNLLLYAGDHRHLDGVPDGAPPPATSAPVRLRGYLDVASGRPEATEGGVLYRDVAHQYLPLYVSCDAPLGVAYEVVRVSDADYESLDPSACRRARDGEGYDCVHEKVVHPAKSRCTFVAVAAKFVTASGKEQSLSLGGRFETTEADPVRVTMTVDRYAFGE